MRNNIAIINQWARLEEKHIERLSFRGYLPSLVLYCHSKYTEIR